MEINVSLDGNKCVSAQVGNHVIKTDQPVRHGGEDSAPAPFELFMASVGCCAGFFVQEYCASKGVSTEGISITLKKQRNTEGEFTGFITCINIPDSLPQKYHSILKNVAKQCSVKKVIMDRPEFVVETASVPSPESTTPQETEQLPA